MKDLGDLHYFLGIEVIHTPESILISQRHYVLSMLFKFGMAGCNSISTPLDRTVKLRPDSGKVCDPKRYSHAAGRLHRCRLGWQRRRSPIHVRIHVLSRECRGRVEQ